MFPWEDLDLDFDEASEEELPEEGAPGPRGHPGRIGSGP